VPSVNSVVITDRTTLAAPLAVVYLLNTGTITGGATNIAGVYQQNYVDSVWLASNLRIQKYYLLQVQMEIFLVLPLLLHFQVLQLFFVVRRWRKNMDLQIL